MSEPAAAARAYGLLWRYLDSDEIPHEARRILRDSLTKEERRAGVAWAIEKLGPVSDAEILAADLRAGVFPERSHP